MTRKEFYHLHDIPLDIARREARIASLEALQAAGPSVVSDVVRASHGEGNACIQGHATVTGTDAMYARRAKQIDLLKRKNLHLQLLYEEGLDLIETCTDLRTRAALSARCVEGRRYCDIARDFAQPDVDAEALRKAVDRWISKNIF